MTALKTLLVAKKSGKIAKHSSAKQDTKIIEISVAKTSTHQQRYQVRKQSQGSEK
jgi:hypothetical protein